MIHPLSQQLVEDGFHTPTVESEVAQGAQRVRTVGIACVCKFLSSPGAGCRRQRHLLKGGVLAHFVLEVHQNALGRLGSDALHGLQRGL